jgi:tripartite-type tricarboxylate transporter receptor subunit TctC
VNKLVSLAFALLAACPFASFAQGSYPDKPIVVIVPQVRRRRQRHHRAHRHAAARQVLKQAMVVDNRTGAGGNIGTALAAKAKPDGYTLLFTTNSAQVINPSLYSSTGFDPVKDFVPVATAAVAGYVLVANPSFPAEQRARAGRVCEEGAAGLAAVRVGRQRDAQSPVRGDAREGRRIQLDARPYKSAARAATDVVGGQLPVSFQSVPVVDRVHPDGKLKVIAVANDKRLKTFPMSRR